METSVLVGLGGRPCGLSAGLYPATDKGSRVGLPSLTPSFHTEKVTTGKQQRRWGICHTSRGVSANALRSSTYLV